MTKSEITYDYLPTTQKKLNGSFNLQGGTTSPGKKKASWPVLRACPSLKRRTY